MNTQLFEIKPRIYGAWKVDKQDCIINNIMLDLHKRAEVEIKEKTAKDVIRIAKKLKKTGKGK